MGVAGVIYICWIGKGVKFGIGMNKVILIIMDMVDLWRWRGLGFDCVGMT